MIRIRLLRLIGLLLIVAALCMQSTAASAATPAAVNFSLRPGGKATIKVFAFCLDQAKKFPTNAEVRPASLADQKLRQALAHIVNKNYDQSQFKQAAFAIWNLRESQWYNKGEDITIAQEIVNASANTPAPGAGQGMALHDAQAQGMVDAVTRNFAPITGNSVDPSNNYFGVGTLEVVNKTNSDQNFYLAFGTVFPAPAPEYQAIMVYGTEILSAEAPVRAAAAPVRAGAAGNISPLMLVGLLGTVGLAMLAASFALRPRTNVR